MKAPTLKVFGSAEVRSDTWSSTRRQTTGSFETHAPQPQVAQGPEITNSYYFGGVLHDTYSLIFHYSDIKASKYATLITYSCKLLWDSASRLCLAIVSRACCILGRIPSLHLFAADVSAI